MWNLLHLVIFPPQFFGMIYGITTLGSVPLLNINIPMSDYINNNDNGIEIMNYVLVLICSMLFAVPVLGFVAVIRYPDIEKDTSGPEVYDYCPHQSLAAKTVC